MCGDQRLQFPHQLAVAACGQPQLGPQFDGGQPQLLQAGRLGLRPRPVGELRQRRPAPQSQRLRQQPQRPGRVAGRRAVGVGDQPLEPGRVDLLGVHIEPVAGRPRGQPRRNRAERPAQRRHPALQGVDRVAGRALAP